ncbi:D-glycero-beta-D-manno-heptose 1-phosphate adenylyltransferase [Limimaricola cinnabarinus]|uniref:Bifunctional protein HldE n=1 Tax=Limimaricola cinnabarinus LL-001 TaxID=1337093 RepID=U2YLL1_9RHOB|nr:D-glycero-beta-D-manno-heptose 1-phosphate adenylyltransferase [Limimaricola cinnabarinus]GAD55986.1 ADP-heptose synthase / D-glycero-beta-D-manno-heptose 7-phosphate kinase [Limimaricola cinnabarinus LL-001]
MIVDQFQDKRILVIGDVMLDHFVRGSVGRVSPEAPALVLHVSNDHWAVGGAGNVAQNIAGLGGVACLVGLVGEDDAARRIEALFADDPRLESHLVADPNWPTIEKTRFIAGDNHLLRADRESKRIPETVEARLIEAIERIAAAGCDAMVISDYAKGLVTPGLIAAVIEVAQRIGVPVIADPKRPNFADYRGCRVLTPNRKELAAATGLPADDDAEIAAAVPVAMSQFGGPIVLTRSEQGISLFDSDGSEMHDPARNRELRDVSGAGDTVAATLALALAGGAALADATRAANAAAGVVVGKSGTSVVTAPELISAMLRNTNETVLESKVAPLNTARNIREDWRQQGLRVGFTNGCFDIVHRGHVTLLAQARARCDRLVVALNTDASVSRLKGPERPIQSEAARAEVIAALGAVDMVLLFDEDTPLAIIDALRPDVLFKGSDYTVDTVVGHELVQGYGGEVELIDLVDGYSTTRIVAKSRALAAS